MKQRLLIWCCLFCLGSLSSKGQNIHFSQNFNLAPLVNVAWVGASPGLGKALAATRTQWNSVTIPYNTHLVAVDYKIGGEDPVLNSGLLVTQDRAGDGQLAHTIVALHLAKTLNLNRSKTNQLQFGIGVQHQQFNLDRSQLQFDNQYQGRYIPSLDPREPGLLSDESFISLKAGVGLRVQGDEYAFLLGIGIQHLNTPNFSMFDGGNVIARLLEIQTGISRKTDQGYLEFYALYGVQSTQEKLLFSLSYKHTGAGTGLYPIFSLNTRLKDALIPALGIGQSNWQGMYSYDINTSALKRSSQGRGAHELTLIYIFHSKRRSQIPDFCPSFI